MTGSVEKRGMVDVTLTLGRPLAQCCGILRVMLLRQGLDKWAYEVDR